MAAYFSSKLKKQIDAAFLAALLTFCLLGTHWIGFSHSISHAQFQSQSEISAISVDVLPSVNHSADVCHLFDALTLGGFVTSEPAIAITHSAPSNQFSLLGWSMNAQTQFEQYQSRAPPNLS